MDSRLKYQDFGSNSKRPHVFLVVLGWFLIFRLPYLQKESVLNLPANSQLQEIGCSLLVMHISIFAWFENCATSLRKECVVVLYWTKWWVSPVLKVSLLFNSWQEKTMHTRLDPINTTTLRLPPLTFQESGLVHSLANLNQVVPILDSKNNSWSLKE